MLSRTRMLTVLVGLISLQALAAENPWQGKPLSELIRYFAGQGIEIIYSSDLVLGDFLVVNEPADGEPIEVLREVLRPHGLTVSAGPGKTWLIIRDSSATRSEVNVGAAEKASDAVQTLPEIVVSSSVYSVRYQRAGSHVFLGRGFTTGLPDVGEETLRSLDRLPGIANGGISARSHIRGGAENEQLIIFDGLRLYEPYHLKDFQAVATTIDQSAVDGIDFYTAGYQARYGDRMSGVVDIEMRDPVEDMENELGLSLFNTWALSTGRFSSEDRGNWLLSARRSNLDFLTRAFNPDYGSPRFLDILLHVGWQLTDRTKVAANYMHSFDKIEISQEDDSEVANARYRNHIAWLKAQTNWSSSLSSSTVLSVTDISNIRSGRSDLPSVMSGVVEDSRDFRSYALTQDWEISSSDSWSFRAGFDFKNLDAEYHYDSALQIFSPFDQVLDNKPALLRSIDLAPTGEQYALYVESRWQVSDDLIFDLGLRWDRQTYSSFEDNEQRSPRFNVLYKIGADTELRIGLGRFYQAQEINELQISDGLSDFHRPQYADHMVASLDHRTETGLSLRAEYYQKDYDAPMPRYENVFDRLVLIPELQIDRVQIAASRAFVKGAELTLTGGDNTAGLIWWVSYVWSSTEERVADVDVRRSWDQKHSLKAGFSMAWGAWDLSVAGSWHSGWPETRLIVEAVQGPGGSTDLVATTTPRNSFDYANFHSLDARASRSFQLPKGDLTLFVEITNLHNNPNPCCTRYTLETTNDGAQAVVGDRSNWLPLVPSIGVVWKF